MGRVYGQAPANVSRKPCSIGRAVKPSSASALAGMPRYVTPAPARTTSRRPGWPMRPPIGRHRAQEPVGEAEPGRPLAADLRRQRHRLAEGRRRPGEVVRLAEPAPVERGDDPGGEVVGVDEPDA